MELEVRVVDGAALARDPQTGRYTRTEAPSPHIVARRAQVAKVYTPEKTYDEVAAELGWSKPTIANDVNALGLDRSRPGTRRKHPKLDPRECDNPDCSEVFPPESWQPDRRFCSPLCAHRATRTEHVRETARKLLNEQHRRATEEIARLNAADYLTATQVAAERKVTVPAVSRWIAVGLLAAERRVIEGEPHQLVRREELDRFNAEEWPRIFARMGPNFPSNWGGERSRLWSRRKRAPDVGKLGGRKPTYTPEQAQAVRSIKAKYPTWGPVTIGRVISNANGKTLTPKQVRGILKPLT